MVDQPGRINRQKKNRARRDALQSRKIHAERRRKGLAFNEEEADIASLWRRVIQYVLDQMLFALCALIIFLVFSFFISGNSWPPIVSLGPQLVFGLAYLVPVISNKGQTFGMRKMNIAIIRLDGKGYLSLKQSTVRWFVLYVIPNLFIVMFSQGKTLNEQVSIAVVGIALTVAIVAPVIFTKYRQGLHDILGGSVLISIRDPLPKA